LGFLFFFIKFPISPSGCGWRWPGVFFWRRLQWHCAPRRAACRRQRGAHRQPAAAASNQSEPGNARGDDHHHRDAVVTPGTNVCGTSHCGSSNGNGTRGSSNGNGGSSRGGGGGRNFGGPDGSGGAVPRVPRRVFVAQQVKSAHSIGRAPIGVNRMHILFLYCSRLCIDCRRFLYFCFSPCIDTIN
jgi:hypothetical protein